MDNIDSNAINFDDMNESSTSYINEINKIKKSMRPPETKLEAMDLLIKDFLRKKYHIRKNAEYSELIEFFLEKKKPHIATFCHEMVEELYSGEENSEPKILLLLDDAKSMIQRELSLKPEAADESTIASMILPIKRENKPSDEDDKHISKQTKKIIDKYISTGEGKPLTEDFEINTREKVADEEIDVLRSRLSLTRKPVTGEQSIIEIDETGKIENIDDLERIKEKIRMKKISSGKI